MRSQWGNACQSLNFCSAEAMSEASAEYEKSDQGTESSPDPPDVAGGQAKVRDRL